MKFKHYLLWFSVLVVSLSIAGCANLRYYSQAIHGQLDLSANKKPIAEVINDPTVPASIKEKLLLAQQYRYYAARHLGLPDNDSYRSYIDLKRRFVAWNVYAATEFSTKSKEWCFAFAGCVNYRGYFSEADAKEYAEQLRKEGYETHIGGVSAYSTLGWFDDPIMNTFVHYPDIELAQLIFHELAHQVAYVQGDSTFNESFASTVQQAGIEQWLKQHGTEQQRAAYQAASENSQRFTDLILKYREQLEGIYTSSGDAEYKRAQKEQTLQAMQQEFAQMKSAWPNFNKYERWFKQKPNNAQIASVALYTQLIPAFQAILAQCNGDLPRFYERVKQLAKLAKEERTKEFEVALQQQSVAQQRAASLSR